MWIVVAVLIGLLVFDVLAMRFGADSRDDRPQHWW